MKAKTVTHICCLKTGDRFYFINDPKKTVWELRLHTMIKFRGRDKKLSVCKTDTDERQRFDANRVVIYLRSTVFKKRRELNDEEYLQKYFIQ